MLKKILQKKNTKRSAFSEFFLTASRKKRKRVFLEIAKKAIQDQRDLMEKA